MLMLYSEILAHLHLIMSLIVLMTEASLNNIFDHQCFVLSNGMFLIILIFLIFQKNMAFPELLMVILNNIE